MLNNITIFKDGETHTEIRYVIAYQGRNGRWYHYLDFAEIQIAKEHIKELRKKNPCRVYGIFEKIEQVTINQIDEDFI